MEGNANKTINACLINEEFAKNKNIKKKQKKLSMRVVIRRNGVRERKGGVKSSCSCVGIDDEPHMREPTRQSKHNKEPSV